MFTPDYSRSSQRVIRFGRAECIVRLVDPRWQQPSIQAIAPAEWPTNWLTRLMRARRIARRIARSINGAQCGEDSRSLRVICSRRKNTRGRKGDCRVRDWSASIGPKRRTVRARWPATLARVLSSAPCDGTPRGAQFHRDVQGDENIWRLDIVPGVSVTSTWETDRERDGRLWKRAILAPLTIMDTWAAVPFVNGLANISCTSRT